MNIFEMQKFYIVVASAVGLSVGLPQIFLSTFSQFFIPLEREYGWSRYELSLIFSLITICIAIASPLYTSLISNFGTRNVLLASIVSFSIALSLPVLVVMDFYLFGLWVMVLGVVGTGTTTFVYLGVFPSWFTKKLGLALGLAAAGIGLGQMVLPVVAQYFISEFGWRVAYLGLAGIALSGALPCAYFIKQPHARSSLIERKSEVDSDPAQENRLDVIGGAGLMLPTHAWKSLRFVALALAFFIVPLIAAACTVHAMPILTDKGFSASEAAKVVGLGGLAIMLARVIAGVMLDIIGAYRVAVIASICAALAPLLFSSWFSGWLVALAPLLYGVALGIEGDLMPFGIRNVYGAENVAVLYGQLFGVFNLGVFLGPIVMGATYDVTGSYELVLIFLSVLGLISIPLFYYGLSKPRFSGRPTSDLELE